MAETANGKCIFCGEVYSKKSIKKHLDQCQTRKEKYAEQDSAKSGYFYCIQAQGRYCPEYWIYFNIPAESSLKKLDKFIRDIWVECCGHLSAFQINKMVYEGSRMNAKLHDVLSVGQEFFYEYDFGTTTELKLKVVSESLASLKDKKVELLARNLPPVIKCSYCDNLATHVCCNCCYDDDGWMCNDCIPEHECGEEMLLPVVNSPRTGVCGYEGGRYDK